MGKNQPNNYAQKEDEPVNLVPLPRKEASKIYSEKEVLKYADKFVLNRDILEDSEDYKKLKIVKFFAYFNAENQIDTCAVRFEDQHGKKHVLTYWYNGKNLKMSGYKTLIYGRNLLAEFPGKPVLIHEGEKCADIGNKELDNFVSVSWNGGGKKWDLIEGLEILKGREVYLLPDDDQMRAASSREVFPPEEQPGIKTMLGLQKKLKKLKIDSINIGVFPEVREVKESGADIEEILQCYSPEIITKEILKLRNSPQNIADKLIKNKEKEDGARNNGKNKINNGIEQRKEAKGKSGENQKSKRNRLELENNSNMGINPDSPSSNGASSDYPFEILGIADDGRAYFLNYENRLLSYELETLTDKKLIGLAGLRFFRNAHNGHPKSQDWIQEIDSIMQISNKIDFNLDKCKGRGAWKDDKGRICYHDGKNTIGDFDPEEIFLRKPVKNIGLKSKDCDAGTRAEIMELSKKFSFATSADAVRLLSHAAISPFGGALTWRTAILVTGESGSGKSTIIRIVYNVISHAFYVSGIKSTASGIVQDAGGDSVNFSIDEAEGKGQKHIERIEDIFSIVRGSTEEGAPKTLMGSATGKSVKYEMKSMFSFGAVNASIGNVADDNRIIKVNIKKQDNFESFVVTMGKIKKLLTKEVCNGIRAFTWRNLKKIIALSERLELIIQIVTKQDARFAAGESILLATNLIVWENQTDNIPDEDLTNYVKEFYSTQTQEEKRDEITEMINRLLDETVFFGQEKDRLSMRFMLVEMKKFLDLKDKLGEALSTMILDDKNIYIQYDTYRAYKKTVEQYGMTVFPSERELAIAQNHHEIMKILQVGKGYQRQLERHKNMIMAKHNINLDAGAKTCTVVGGFLEYNLEEE